MPSNAGPCAMDSWPIKWKLGQRAPVGSLVTGALNTMGLRAWSDGHLLVPNPLGSGGFRCKLELWRPGLIFRFRDGLPATLISWDQWSQVLTAVESQTGSTGLMLLSELLLAESHPLRFSPYTFLGEDFGIFLGREREIRLLLSDLPGIVVAGKSGVGKTGLLRRAARGSGGRVIACHALDWRGLSAILQGENLPDLVFLDEMDRLLTDSRVQKLLVTLDGKGIRWRAAVHSSCRAPGLLVKLGPPKGMRELLEPLARISGAPIGQSAEHLLLRKAGGSPRELQLLCTLVLGQMGPLPGRVTTALVRAALRGSAMKAGVGW